MFSNVRVFLLCAYPKCHWEAASTQGEGSQATITWTTATPVSTLFATVQSSNRIKKSPKDSPCMKSCSSSFVKEKNHSFCVLCPYNGVWDAISHYCVIRNPHLRTKWADNVLPLWCICTEICAMPYAWLSCRRGWFSPSDLYFAAIKNKFCF